MQLSARDRVLFDYAYLSDGETTNSQLCPACNGGTSRDLSLSVSRREGRLLWICYRASCSFKGSSSSTFTSASQSTAVPYKKAVAGRELHRSSVRIGQDAADYLSTQYHIDEKLSAWAEFGWSEDENRLVMPVKSYTGEVLGVMLRSLSGQQPKVLSFTEKGSIAWYVNRITPGVIIVEDQLSAARASRYLTSVALLGTNLSPERAAEIKATGLSPVHLALDNDAIAQAVRYVTKYRSQLPMQLVRLHKDIKDMTHEEADALFAGVSTGGSRHTHSHRVC